MTDERLPPHHCGLVIALLAIAAWCAVLMLSELVIRAVELLLS